MRRLRACIQIMAPVQTVRTLTDADHRSEWMSTPKSAWVRTLAESWEATESNGGTLLSMNMEYQYRLPFLETLAGEDFQHAVTRSLSRLKQMAEGQTEPVLSAR